GEKVAQGLDEARETSDLVARARGEFLEQVSNPTAGPSRVRVGLGLAAATGLAAAAAVVSLVLWHNDGALTATIGEDQRAVEPGEWITAPAESSLPVRFSDGSLIELEPLSAARVVDVDDRGARILLEKGTVRAEVVHRDDTSWTLDVGPYEVRVTGTRFEAAWDPESQQFSLDLHEGGVLVRGPMVTDGQALSAGNAFRAWVGEQRVELASLDSDRVSLWDETTSPEQVVDGDARDDPTAAAGAGAIPEIAGEQLEPDTAPVRTPPRADAGIKIEAVPLPPEVETTWRELARQGRYGEAIEAAESQGFERVLIGATPRDLKTLGDAARLSRDFGRAEQCYLELRQRYPGTAHATKAAFALGRMAFDQQHLYSKSAKWLDQYLKESGGGGLDREALGRLVEARHRAGDLRGALNAARRYVSSYPDGPHAAYAHKILDEAESKGDPP
ncbi:MAG: FecR domain-containing protein, partial [Deltaproteobacteria bacterium]|nr:FecR domain-containing protein [Deltaproteobacteria bacterium]